MLTELITKNRYELFIGGWLLIGILAFIYLLFKEAPYGRFSNRNWGPVISNKLGWMVMEGTVIFTFLWWIPFDTFNWRTPATVMIGLFMVHYVHRSFIFPFMTRTKGKKMPLVIMLSAMLFNTVNGSLMGIWFSRFAHYTNSWYTSPAFIAGIILFLLGMAVNWISDYQLINLRKPGETGYKIPTAGLSNYVSSPNLFGEIMEWSGYALLTWSLPGVTFLIWTCANLIPRAISVHRWYHQQFPEYPASRKVLFPFIW